VRENAHALRLTESAWSKVKVVRDQMMFVDPITGNILVRAGVELDAGKPAYLSTRIRVNSSGLIADVEIASDQSENVVTDYVWNLNPIYTETLPAHQRIERVEMEAIVRRYFNALDSHLPVQSDFDNGVCNRFHSGWQVTNVELNAVEGGSMLTCVSSMEGTPPWGPATEQRIPVIDTERGIVVGITLLHYLDEPEQPVMYVTEVFKIVGGKIVQIDNIGLMLPNIDTLGFVH